ncbi:hypothetical protein BsWGS_25527 [Bradybaena similaris]
MTAELQWRRRWKPDLKHSPWKPLEQVDVQDSEDSSHKYFMKTKFDDSSYELLLTDLTHFWYEQLTEDSLKKRVAKLNPSIEAPLTKILDQIQRSIEKPEKETQLSVSRRNERIVEVSSLLAGMPFHYTFQAELASPEVGQEHLTIPLMAMVGELYRQQQELFKLLALKDKQIDDYKSQGIKVSRKYLETAPFDEVAFHNSMMTSKGFEEEVKTFGEKAFTSLGQDLYREISTKRAWLLSSPVKDGDVEVSELSESTTGAPGGPSVESWSNRLPTSLVQKNPSPSKQPASSNISPAKSPTSSKSSSTESTPTKDTELLRRQALERKLQMEEAKEQEKTKKKKKLKF